MSRNRNASLILAVASMFLAVTPKISHAQDYNSMCSSSNPNCRMAIMMCTFNCDYAGAVASGRYTREQTNALLANCVHRALGEPASSNPMNDACSLLKSCIEGCGGSRVEVYQHEAWERCAGICGNRYDAACNR
jgi:hypothetical protein